MFRARSSRSWTSDQVEEVFLEDLEAWDIPEEYRASATASGAVLMAIALGPRVFALRDEEAVEVLRELRRMQRRSARSGSGLCLQLAWCPHRPGWTRVGVGVEVGGS